MTPAGEFRDDASIHGVDTVLRGNDVCQYLMAVRQDGGRGLVAGGLDAQGKHSAGSVRGRRPEPSLGCSAELLLCAGLGRLLLGSRIARQEVECLLQLSVAGHIFTGQFHPAPAPQFFFWIV